MPLRYFVEVGLANRASRTVYVKAFRLHVETLAPDEFRTVAVSFPVDDERAVRERGVFTLQVEPTRGRTSRASGEFPVSRT